MKLDLSKEECLRLAAAEGDSEVGAGMLARDPVWQPIETAPLDGTEVDLWCKPADYPYGGRATDCHYQCGEWLKYGADPEVGFIKIENATHWRPLPDPPVNS